jgi:two-component system phosphate regulon response regulator PhoB
MTKESILIIEDDPKIQELLAHAMSREGWKLYQVKTGEEGLKILETKKINCILPNILLPGIDGLEVLKRIKETKQYRSIPVIMTTANGKEANITGLELGDSDYAVKSYSIKMFIARIRMGLRRQKENEAKRFISILQQGELILDTERYVAFYGDQQLDLSVTEFALLKHFLSHPDIVFSRNQIITAIRGPDYPATARSVDVQILGLRKKLGKASPDKSGGDIIETVHGVGYRFKLPEPPAT